MPTVLRIGGCRFFFYSNENGEPCHIHVQRERLVAKFWLRPVSLASSNGFAARELRKMLSLVEEHKQTFEEVRGGFFGN